MKRKLCVCLLLFVVSVPALSAPPPGVKGRKASPARARDAAAVRAAFERLLRAFNARDARAVMASFADDVILSYPGLPDSRYREIGEAFTKMFAPRPGVTQTWEAEVEEIQVSGDMAFVRVLWTYRAERTNPDKQFTSREKDLEVWRRQRDGGWKLSRGLSYPVTPNPSATPQPSPSGSR